MPHIKLQYNKPRVRCLGACLAIAALQYSTALAAPLELAPQSDGVVKQVRPSAIALDQLLSSPDLSPEIQGAVRDDLAAAIKAFAQARFELAEKLSRKVVEAAPNAGEGWHILGLALANLEQYEPALEALETANGLYRRNPTLYVVQGDILRLLGRDGEAANAYASAIERDPSFSAAHEKAGDMKMSAGDAAAAIADYRKAVETSSAGEFGPRGKLARAYAEAGRSEDAVKEIQTFLQTAPDSVPAHIALAQAQISAGDTDQAIAALERAAEITPSNPVPLLSLAVIYRANGDLKAEREALNKALERSNDNIMARRQLGLLDLKENRTDAALKNLKAAEDLAPKKDFGAKAELAALYIADDRAKDALKLLSYWKDAPEDAPEAALAALAQANAAAGNEEEAKRLFQTRINKSGSLEAHLAYARYLRGNLDFTGAERVLSNASDAYPESALPWLELGRVYGAETRYDAALDAFKSGLEKAPDMTELDRGALLAEFRLGQMDAARTRAARLAARPDAGAGDYIWLGSIDEALGRESDAAASYEAALKLDPDNWVAANNLSVLLLDTNPSRSLELAKTAAEKSGGLAAAQDTLGWAHFTNGGLGEAQSIFEALAAANPQDAKTRYRLGRVLLERGQQSKGRAAIAKALELDPEFSEAETARTLLNAD